MRLCTTPRHSASCASVRQPSADFTASRYSLIVTPGRQRFYECLENSKSRDFNPRPVRALAVSLHSMSQDRTHDVAEAMSRLERLLEVLAIALLVYLTIWCLAP